MLRFEITNSTTVTAAQGYKATVDAELDALCVRRNAIEDQLGDHGYWVDAKAIAEHPETINFKERFRALMSEASFYSWALTEIKRVKAL